MRQTDRRGLTRATLVEAVLHLQQQRANRAELTADTGAQPSPGITISDICREAKVARPTFYQYFASADAAVAAACRQRLTRHFEESDSFVPNGTPGSDSDVMIHWLNLLHQDTLLQTALAEGGAATRYEAIVVIADELHQRWDAGDDDPGLGWRARFAAAGLLSVISVWHHEDQPAETSERIVELTVGLTQLVMRTTGVEV